MKKGFTLIELLVVTSIIGLLAALLFPVLVKVREKGHQAVCLSNERQLGLAITQYTADNDGFYPTDRTRETAGEWALQVFPYVKTPSVFRCPDDPTTDSQTSDAGRTDHYFVDSYGINLNLLESVRYDPARGVATVVKPSAAEAVLAAPERTALLFEVTGDTAAMAPPHNRSLGCAASGNGNRDPSAPGLPFAEGCRPTADMIVFGTRYATGPIGGRVTGTDASGFYYSGIETTEPRHSGGADYLACDGHAVWMGATRVSGGQSQALGGADCGQDDPARGCGGNNTAAGTANARYGLTFSIH